ncbi:MAG TPA: methyltransferase domain-containing protein, partial [Ktedonobacterales bacterium]|nr:methyltransferase domain-containing protein [Ktedonobacterales bacterium]
LAWTIAARAGARIEQAEARCAACAASYPVREGIGIFLTPDLPRDDLWEQAESGLMRFVRGDPAIERQLMDGPAAALGPADQFFRALVLEERGEYAPARAVAGLAHQGLYTAEYRACHERQRQEVVAHVAAATGPIVDLASGRGDLVERLARELSQPIIASDFSPQVLRRDRRWLAHWGLYDRVSLLAFDARRTPFKDGVVTTMTTNLGLPNIEQPLDALRELRRVVAGTLLAISCFYPEADIPNVAAIQATGDNPLLFRAPALASFATAGWQVALAGACAGSALPTPRGVVIADAGIDGLPVAPTTLEWATLVAR